MGCTRYRIPGCLYLFLIRPCIIHIVKFIIIIPIPILASIPLRTFPLDKSLYCRPCLNGNWSYILRPELKTVLATKRMPCLRELSLKISPTLIYKTLSADLTLVIPQNDRSWQRCSMQKWCSSRYILKSKNSSTTSWCFLDFEESCPRET